MDSRPYRAIAPKGAFCAGEDGSPEPVAWWNGKSAVLDLTSPAAVEWLKGELDVLVRKYGVDGFKFDAADVQFYTGKGMRLPAGRWLADDGEVFTGPARITVKTPLSRLPHFTRAE